MKKFIGLFLLLSACSSAPKIECEKSNWFDRGKEDALSGKKRQAWQPLKEACGPSFRKEEYQSGYEKGLEAFCQVEKAYHYGREGGEYHGTCKAFRYRGFEEAYNKGKEAYRLERRLAEVERELDRMNQRLHSQSVTRRHKNTLFQRIRKKQNQKAQIKSELSSLKAPKGD